MGQKDLTEKSLEFYPDVFADVVNVLLYRGQRVLEPESLNPAPTETLYPGKEGQLHNQFHDVSKYEMQDGCIRAQYTLENETKVNRKLVLRKAGYEGAVYRGQYDGEDEYPFVSLVLYWGKRRWRAPRSLRQLFAKSGAGKVAEDASGGVVEDLGVADVAGYRDVFEYMDNVRLHVYEMAHLPKAVRERFCSDMRIVVDYLAEGKDYVPTGQKIVHVEALLRMLQALTGDSRYEEIIPAVQEEERTMGGVSMCELLDKYENRGIEKGTEKGMEKGMELIKRLLNDGRMEDIAMVVADKEYQKQLIIEYGV